MKKSIKKNYIYNLLYQILLLITPFITTPYLSRVLEADGIGTVSYAESIVSYFTLFAAMGIATYGQREISYVQNSKYKRSVVFWNAKIFEFITAFVAFCIYFIFSLFQQNKIIYLLLSFNVLAVFADITWFFQGLEEFGKIVARNMFFKLLNITYIFIFIREKDDIFLYVFGLAFFLFLSNISLWGYLPKYICKIKKNEIKPFKDINIILSLFIPTIAVQIYTVLDKTMIGAITKSSFENGYYEQAIKLSKMVLTVVTALGTVMIPRIGYYYNQKQTNEIQHLMYRGYRFVWFLGIPLCCVLIMVSGNFVPWFFGPGYDKVSLLIKILSLLILAIGINNVTGMQYLIPTKRQNTFTLTVIIGAVTNFCLNMILIYFFKSVGAAVASVTAETLIAVIQIIIVRKELKPLRILAEGIHYYISGFIMMLVLGILVGKLKPSVLSTGIIVFIGMFVYTSALLIIKDEFFISNIKNALKLLNRHKA